MAVRDVPASAGQRLLWLLDHHRGENGALNCPLLCRFRGVLDVVLLDRALRELAGRHESLRTRFAGRGPGLRQRVLDDDSHIAVREVDLTVVATPRAALDDAVAGELCRRMDPTEEPVRATLWRLDNDDHVLCLNMHHLITDAWSNRILFEDLMNLLDPASHGRSMLPPSGWQYTRFTEWQREQWDGAQMRAHGDYWRGQLAGAKPPAMFQLAPSTVRDFRLTSCVALDIAPPVVEALRRLASQCRTTLFCAALSVHYALLRELTGQDDLTVASLFANRTRPELYRTVGFIANMVLLRTRIPRGASFVDLLRATHSTVVEAFVHQAMPFHMLPPGVMANTPMRADDAVFQMMADSVYSTRVAGLDVEVLVPEGVSSRFDLELALVARNRGYRAVLFSNPQRVPVSFTHEVLTGYAALAQEVTTRPATSLSRLPRRWHGPAPTSSGGCRQPVSVS